MMDDFIIHPLERAAVFGDPRLPWATFDILLPDATINGARICNGRLTLPDDAPPLSPGLQRRIAEEATRQAKYRGPVLD
jgi:hypothetical protein